MTSPADLISVVVAVEFVVMATVLVLLVPLDVVAPLLPLLVVFVIALSLYRS